MSIFSVTKGHSGGIIPHRLTTNLTGTNVYTPVVMLPTLSGNPPVPNDPIDLILGILMSNAGDGSNGSYDTFEPGVGLGIPADHIDIASFQAIQQQPDWASGSRAVYFSFREPEAAKDFIDEELCRPFGIYLRTGNDGLIRCIRPLHPQKFYVSDANNYINVNYNSTGSVIAILPIGVTTAPQMASNVAAALNYVTPGKPFSCSYDTSAHRFTISSSAGPFVLDTVPAMAMLGWPNGSLSTTSTTAPNQTGAFTGPTLTEADMWAVRQIDNRDDQVTSVQFMYGYSDDGGKYHTTRPYNDPEATNLGDTMGDHQLVIKSRGLISTLERTSVSWVHCFAPGTNCTPKRISPELKYGVESDTWAKLYALTLLDRYKQPPLKFSARLKWSWNTLEVGDVVRVNYSIPGVFADYELNASTLNNRLFEVVALDPNFDGSVDATFLGFRHVNY